MNLEVCHLKKHYAGQTVLEDFSLTLPSEGVTALCGPSGCGKTTLMRLIAGLETADAGTINGLDGAKISMVFQEDRLLPWCTAEQNIAIAAPGTEAAFWMEQSGIADARQKLPDELSGGMRRRVAIARAIVNRPQVLLLDEPLGALDLKLRKDMQIELKRIQQQVGITFVYVTHDQEEALTMSDRIAVMNAGVIEQLGTPMEIYDHPLTRFVAGFIGESNIFDGTVTAVEGDLLRVDTPAGKLLTRGSGFAVGEEMHVSIRPEYLEAGERSADGFDLPARIKDFTYMGTVVKTALDMADGTELKLSRFEQDANAHEGDKVYLSWRPEKSVPIKKSHT